MTTELTSAVHHGRTLPGVTHHFADLDGIRLHYTAAGTTGSPILLVHGWPETWWAFRGLIPLLAESHRVFAVDLRGFGDSIQTSGSPAGGGAGIDYSEAASAEDLHRLVRHLGVGPVHVLCQDISGGLTFTFAATHPADVLSLTGIETTLAGFGLEMLADVNNGGSWHLGFLGTPGIPELMLGGHERDLLSWAYQVMGTPIDAPDFEEFARTYTTPDAWRGPAGLYRSLFTDAGTTRTLASTSPLLMPVLAIDGPNHPFTANTLRQVTAGDVTAVHIEGTGHLVAQESPIEVATALLSFTARVDEA